MDCTLGYYHKPNAATPKGTALFLRKHGPEAYTQALSNAIHTGVRYAEDLDALNDAEKVCAILEKNLC